MTTRITDARKAVVLLSGGMDSCVCAAIARERHGAGNIALLHAGYGQRTERRERRAFDDIAEFYGARERLLVQLHNFPSLGGSARTSPKHAAPAKERRAKARPGTSRSASSRACRNAA